MSKDTKKSNSEKKTAKASPSAAKAAAKKPASATAVKRPKAVQKKPAASSAPKPTAKSGAKPATKTPKAAKERTTVLVQADVGFGNQLFVRGEGPGLSWDRGAPMQYRESNQWEWSTEGAKEEFPFKVLINDQVWAHGENDKVTPGETKVIQPAF